MGVGINFLIKEINTLQYKPEENSMPKNYQNSRIYLIRSYKIDDVYVGSTTQTLSKRIGQHRSNYKRYLNGKGNYITSFKLLEQGDAYIELLERFPCDSKEELSAREGYFIRERECVNIVVPGRTQAEYRQDNKQKLKQYNQDNKERIKERIKQYNKDNKEQIQAQQKQKYNCDCGGRYTHKHKPRHYRTKRHSDWIELQYYLDIYGRV